jgi:hypothetical protein
MAWNPAPEVQVARDAAKKLGELAKAEVDQVVIVYTTADRKAGSVSYGRTRQLCGQARRLGGRLYEAVINEYRLGRLPEVHAPAAVVVVFDDGSHLKRDFEDAEAAQAYYEAVKLLGDIVRRVDIEQA